MSRKMKMFMCHANEDQFDILEDIIKSYKTQYLIALETNPYHHYHFMVEFTDEEYHKFSKHVFKDKYKLRGRAIAGKPRQYGVVKHIKDIEQATAYTLKDGNYRTNMDHEVIQKCLEKSYEKTDKNLEVAKLHSYLDDYLRKQPNHVEIDKSLSIYWDEFGNFNKPSINIRENLLTEIYRYIHVEKSKLSLSRTAINNYFLNYLRTTELLTISERINLSMCHNGHSFN